MLAIEIACFGGPEVLVPIERPKPAPGPHEVLIKVQAARVARTPEEKGRIAIALAVNVWPALPAKNPIRPITDSTFPLVDAFRAHQRMESGHHVVKIVLLF